MGAPSQPFINRMTSLQTALGWIFLPLYVVVLPMLLGILTYLSPWELTGTEVNLLFACISLAAVMVMMFSFFRRSFYVLWENPAHCLGTILWGLAALYAMSMAVNLALMLLERTETTPNDQTISDMMESSPGVLAGIIIFLDPIIEETLFRGVVFGSIRLRSRFWAYTASIVLFAMSHVWQYALGYQDPWVLLFAFRYVPHSLALAWCYERSGTIWAPIFFHMLYNALSLLAV